VIAAEKFDALAEGYAARTYADPDAYARGRAELVVSLGPKLYPCDEVLDLACGHAHMAEPLQAQGLRYRGVDGSEGMIAEARRLHGERLPLEVAPMESYEPPEPVAATVILNAIGYPDDRVAFFRHVAGYTTTKLVFDFNPRLHEPAEVERDLRLAGLQFAARRAYLAPQSRRLPAPVAAVLRRLEPVDAAAALLLRLGGQWLYAAVPYRV
jgi:SAM-dependent methyltransferase